MSWLCGRTGTHYDTLPRTQTHTHIFTHIHTHPQTLTKAHMYSYAYTHTHACMHSCAYRHTYTQSDTHTSIYGEACFHVHTYMHGCACSHTHPEAETHTSTHVSVSAAVPVFQVHCLAHSDGSANRCRTRAPRLRTHACHMHGNRHRDRNCSHKVAMNDSIHSLGWWIGTCIIKYTDGRTNHVTVPGVHDGRLASVSVRESVSGRLRPKESWVSATYIDCSQLGMWSLGGSSRVDLATEYVTASLANYVITQLCNTDGVSKYPGDWSIDLLNYRLTTDDLLT
eukprot:GHVU01110827.1.p1 GENE.GHVU01110827.1~~GHVU01110827.1.p1  ORF type:complete len:282 (+),score=-7.57 GHVU01110827.1:532-1377(+)